MAATQDEITKSAEPGPPPGSVTVVITNWNRAADLEQCLESLSAQSYRGALEVLVVDNGSTDNSVATAERFAPLVRCLRNNKNRGFAEATNQGIRGSKSEYVALLNNDTVVDPEWLAELIAMIETAPDIGSCTSKVLSFSEPKIIDNVGHVLFRDGLTRGRGRTEIDHGQYDDAVEVFCASGCACLFRRATLEDVGLLDESFFAYCEDADLGFRLRLRGWRCLFASGAIVFHKFSASSEPFSPMKALNVERNRIWLAAKNLPLSLLFLSLIATTARYFWQAYGAFAGRGASGVFAEDYSRSQLITLLFRAYWQSILGLPRILGQRRIIQSRRTVTTSQVRRWIRDFGISARDIGLME